MNMPPPINVAGPVTPEFLKMAVEQMRLMFAGADPLGQQAVSTTRWVIAVEPTAAQIASLADRPPPNAVMLGLFSPNPHTITLFETPIRTISAQEKIGVAQKLREVMVHELQHRFGFNHLTVPKEAVARQRAISTACNRLAGDCSTTS